MKINIRQIRGIFSKGLLFLISFQTIHQTKEVAGAKISKTSECGISIATAWRQPRLLFEPLTYDGDNYEERIGKKDADNSTIYSISNQGPRLINGKESVRGAWPWQVSLQVLHPKFGFINHWCGGVLIYPSWVVTAAHCIHNEIFSLNLAILWTALLGEWNRRVEEHTETRISVESILVHEEFHDFQNDIALLKLSRPIGSSDVGIHAICLPDENAVPDQCVATGWGKTEPKGPLSSTLRQIRVPLYNHTACKAKYGSSVPINTSHLCGGRIDGNSGACIGDSGGPLQCILRDGRWFLAGIISFGPGCGKPGHPDVYTKLSHYIPWIRGKVDKYGKN